MQQQEKRIAFGNGDPQMPAFVLGLIFGLLGARICFVGLGWIPVGLAFVGLAAFLGMCGLGLIRGQDNW